jgi:hypothetical protein
MLLATSVCGVDKDIKIMKELATLVPPKGTIMAADLYTALQNTLMTCLLKINVYALTTDGIPALLCNKESEATITEKDAK